MMKEYAEVFSRADLIRLLVHGQLRASVHRAFLGTLWYTLVPALQIAIYYFLIVVIFMRGASFGFNPFVGIAIGIMHYMVLTQCISYGGSAITNNASLLLQVKIEPIVLIASGYYKAVRTSLVGVALALVVYFLIDPLLTYRLLFYPVIILLWLLFCWIVVLFVACVSVYLRDLQRLIPFLFQLVMYTSPVIYTVNFYPAWLRDYVLHVPPVTIFALIQWSLFGTPAPSLQHMVTLAVSLLVGLICANHFYLWARKGFTKAF